MQKVNDAIQRMWKPAGINKAKDQDQQNKTTISKVLVDSSANELPVLKQILMLQ